ncbi:MAG: hypothetical protein M1270_06095 [Gammaproteobacteria bacterium]|jgi:hypothetical protein|nr:hypothetical protein [Gammaproteobacteria bacterium]
MLGITKKITGLTGILVFIVFLSGCTQTIDSSSEKTLKESEENIRQSLSTQDSIIFDKAARYMRSNMSTEDYRLAVDGFNSEEVVEAALQLEAKNKQEMLDAAQAKVDEYEKMKEVLDGIEILSIHDGFFGSAGIDLGERRITVKNNSKTDITQLRFNGEIVIRIHEDTAARWGRAITPGDQTFALNYMARLEFDEPLKAGETGTVSGTIHDGKFDNNGNLNGYTSGTQLVLTDALLTEKNQIINDDNIGVYYYSYINENGEKDFIMWPENEYIKTVAARDKIFNMPSKIRD